MSNLKDHIVVKTYDDGELHLSTKLAHEAAERTKANGGTIRAYRIVTTFNAEEFFSEDEDKELEQLKAENSKMRQAPEPFIVAARHARNFPHPQIPVERLRSEATLAESNAEHLLGIKEYHTICESAFKDQ